MAEINTISHLFNKASLEAYYRFESGADTVDSSSNSNTLTHVNAPTNVAGKYGNCMDYESGSTQGSYATDSASLDLTGQFTISVWINIESLPPSNDSYMMIVDKTNYSAPDTSGYWIDLNKTAGGVQTVRAGFTYNPGANNRTATWTTTLSTATWYHLVGRHDGTNMELICNTSSEASTASTGVNPSDSPSALTIGKYSTADVRHFDGKIDDVAVFSEALTDAEILTLYNDGPTSSMFSVM